MGGAAGPAVTCTEVYNGITWAVGIAMITVRQQLAGVGGAGAALAFGGLTPSVTGATESYSTG
jgi:hypothetical protein